MSLSAGDHMPKHKEKTKAIKEYLQFPAIKPTNIHIHAHFLPSCNTEVSPVKPELYTPLLLTNISIIIPYFIYSTTF